MPQSDPLSMPESVAALQAKVEELVADSDASSTNQPAADAIVAQNSDPNVSRMQPAQAVKISEAIEVPIAEQVASHIASARLVKSEGKQELTITLDPPRLGTISLEIVDSNDVLVAKVTAAEPVALQALQSNLSSLLDSLEQAGIEFDKFEFSQQDQQQQQDKNQRFDEENHPAINAPHSYGASTQSDSTDAQPSTPSTTNKRLDITV
jgi:flagellar hook-length control protein FliK